jgi:hypothetical protein
VSGCHTLPDVFVTCSASSSSLHHGSSHHTILNLVIMPGPRNGKKGKKVHVKKSKKSTSITAIQAPVPPEPSLPVHKLEPPSSDIDCPIYTPPHTRQTPHIQDLHDDFIPSIHDPGNGPRVRDVRAFLSSFFAQPPSLDDPLWRSSRRKKSFRCSAPRYQMKPPQ